jgi:hypothetical protein
VSISDELKERNILKLILVVRFACATLDVGHPTYGDEKNLLQNMDGTVAGSVLQLEHDNSVCYPST